MEGFVLNLACCISTSEATSALSSEPNIETKRNQAYNWSCTTHPPEQTQRDSRCWRHRPSLGQSPRDSVPQSTACSSRIHHGGWSTRGQHLHIRMTRKRRETVCQCRLVVLSAPYQQVVKRDHVPAVAPKAIALITSVALLTPPSTNNWNFSLGKFNPRLIFNSLVTSTRTSIPDRAKSSWRPPWFESTTPANPRS